jgi:ADP-heptose:LPS heptosyltransferase
MQKRHCNMLSILTSKSIANFPMRCNISGDIFDELKKRLNLPDNYIVICAISKNPPKDMPIDTAIDLIKLINNTEYKPVLVGAGALSEKYAADLDSAGASYINTVGKTTIYELANVIKNAKCLVSVDTGTMHLGCAIQTPTIAVFYEQITLKPWSPNPEIYNSVIINKEQTPQNIFNAVKTKLI